MGSPLAPVLVNIFMGVTAFDSEQDSLNFLNFFNNKHPNIKFTIEKQINHSITFLDILISSINIQNLPLQTYHKSTYTKSNHIKNAYPSILIDKVFKKNLDYNFPSNQNQLKYKSEVHYFKLPYIGNLSHHIKNELSKLWREFFKENFNMKLVFNSFKIKNYL